LAGLPPELSAPLATLPFAPIFHPSSTQLYQTTMRLIYVLPFFRLHPFSTPLLPNSARRLCNSRLDGSLLCALHPSSTRQLPTAPYTPMFDLAAPNGPLSYAPCTLVFDPTLSCLCCTHVRPGPQWLSLVRFALNAVNPCLEGSVTERNDSGPFYARPNVPPPLSSCCYSILFGFLVTCFPCCFFRPPSLICFEFFPFSEYIAMAPSRRTFLSPYYSELCDRTLVPDANLEEHKAWAIHRGLLERCWRRRWRWRDVNFECSEKTWRSVVVNKSYRPNKPS
jgi:hypothetical protein